MPSIIQPLRQRLPYAGVPHKEHFPERAHENSRKTRLTLTLRQRAITRSSTSEEIVMTPPPRTFTALLAASAVALPRLSFGQGAARTGTVRTRDGVELFVKDTGGNGRAIVLTHAWPLNADIW